MRGVCVINGIVRRICFCVRCLRKQMCVYVMLCGCFMYVQPSSVRVLRADETYDKVDVANVRPSRWFSGLAMEAAVPWVGCDDCVCAPQTQRLTHKPRPWHIPTQTCPDSKAVPITRITGIAWKIHKIEQTLSKWRSRSCSRICMPPALGTMVHNDSIEEWWKNNFFLLRKERK